MTYVFIDDIRESPMTNHHQFCDDIVTCRSYDAAIQMINVLRDLHVNFILDLDHDLGEEKSGYDICKYIVENQIPMHGYLVHSMNPVGRKNMRQLLDRYGYKELK